MVTQSHKIIYFTKVSPKSSPSMPSIFPKRSREKKKNHQKTTPYFFYRGETEANWSFSCSCIWVPAESKKKRSKGWSGQKKQQGWRNIWTAAGKPETVTGEQPGLNAEPGYSPGSRVDSSHPRHPPRNAWGWRAQLTGKCPLIFKSARGTGTTGLLQGPCLKITHDFCSCSSSALYVPWNMHGKCFGYP